MKALVGAFNQEKALVGAFSVIVQPVVEPMDSFTALLISQQLTVAQPGQPYISNYIAMVQNLGLNFINNLAAKNWRERFLDAFNERIVFDKRMY